MARVCREVKFPPNTHFCKSHLATGVGVSLGGSTASLALAAWHCRCSLSAYNQS